MDIENLNNKEIMPAMIFFKFLVLPHLEYCSMLTALFRAGENKDYLQPVKHLNYWAHLKILNTYSLESYSRAWVPNLHAGRSEKQECGGNTNIDGPRRYQILMGQVYKSSRGSDKYLHQAVIDTWVNSLAHDRALGVEKLLVLIKVNNHK